jgi:hypothetical protein
MRSRSPHSASTHTAMKVLICTWPRRFGWAVLTLICACAVGLWLLWHDSVAGVIVSERHVFTNLLIAPACLAALTLLGTSLAARPPASSATSSQPPPSPGSLMATAIVPKPPMAQVLGLQWLNPLQRRDYPTQWQLLWTLGLASPNDDDDWVATDPDTYSKVQVVAPVVGNASLEPADLFARYTAKLLDLLHDPYFSNPAAFYTACAQDKQHRRELAGIHVVCALPDSLDADESGALLRESIARTFGLSGKALPTVRVVQGGSTAGPSALSIALDYLRQHPDQTVWVLGWDAPQAPTDEPQLSENLVLVVLGGLDVVTDREPLAWLGYPATHSTESFHISKDAPSRTVQALAAAFKNAAANAGRPEFDVGFVLHNAGTASDVLGAIGEALTTEAPELNVARQSFNARTFFGGAGGCESLVNVALAIGYAHHFGRAALMVETALPERPLAMMVAPPKRPSMLHPPRPWFRSSSEAHAYLPWWGRRADFAPTGRLGTPS